MTTQVGVQAFWGEGVPTCEREAGESHPQNSGRRDNVVMSLRLESRLTVVPRTGMLDTMRSVEACKSACEGRQSALLLSD